MIYTEKVIDVSNQGYGVCKLDGFTIFIKGAMKDEVVSFKLKNKKKKFAIGDLVSIDKASPYRRQEALIESAPLFHWDYQHQLEYKNHLVENTLNNFINEANYHEIIGQEHPYHYRNKAQIPLLEHKGEVVLGEFIEGSNELIPLTDLKLYDEKIIQALDVVVELMNENHMKVYNRQTRSGDFKHVIVRSSHYSDEIMIVLVASYALDLKKEFIQSLQEKLPHMTSLMLNINKEKSSVIFGKKTKKIVGEDQYMDALLDHKFLVSSQSFYQINSEQTEKLYTEALKSLNKQDTLLDAYCGIGTMSLIAADKVNNVIGIEINEDAIKMANKNKIINGKDNVEFICGPVDNYLETLEDVNTLLVDPPRAGLSKMFVDKVSASGINKMIYVSCDLMTLKRDLMRLSPTFTVQSIQAVDMFPHTPHVETIVLLQREDT